MNASEKARFYDFDQNLYTCNLRLGMKSLADFIIQEAR